MRTFSRQSSARVGFSVQRLKALFWSIAALLTTVLAAVGQPTIIRQPTDQSASLGASVSFQVVATTTNPPVYYQWRLNASDLSFATNITCLVTNAQLTNAGPYDVVLTDGGGARTSLVARLNVDPTFTKITSSPVVSDKGSWAACSWADYDGDGFLDLLVMSPAGVNGVLERNALYHNDRHGGFVRVLPGPFVTEFGDWRACAWADYNEDGYLDVIVTRDDIAGFPDQAELFRNNGNGTFSKVSTALSGTRTSGGYAEGSVWGDYDNDGFLDLYVASYGADWLLHNNGDATFTRITSGAGVLPDAQDSYTAVWGDYDNDGWPDLFVAVKNDFGTNQSNFLYHNDHNGAFSRIRSGAIATDNEYSAGCAWVDYDNDGFLDMFVVNGLDTLGTNSLYHNNGDGTFNKQTPQQAGPIASDASYFSCCTWGDYDNDGFLDAFVTTTRNDVSFLYHNNGNGSFTRILSGSLANDKGTAYGCAWGDYDNDGFLDLVVTRGAHDLATNLFYHNNGNSNAWVKADLVGTLSNRSGVGAKVHLKATIGGRAFWQMRVINTGNGFTAGPLQAHFGLGDATNIDLLRVEWPSGVVQTLTNVAPRRVLTVVEHQDLLGGTIAFSGIERLTNGSVNLQFRGNPGPLYRIEASTDLRTWTKLAVRTNQSGTVELVDTQAGHQRQRFYRALAP